MFSDHKKKHQEPRRISAKVKYFAVASVAILILWTIMASPAGGLFQYTPDEDEFYLAPIIYNSTEWHSAHYINKHLSLTHEGNSERLGESKLCKDVIEVPRENEDEPFVHICADHIKPPCNVVSLGIAYNFLIDDIFLQRGCRVWSFDPSMRPGDYTRGPLHKFFPIGIGAYDGMYHGPNTLYENEYSSDSFEIKSLPTIMKEMGVEYLDAVRMDVEGAEWAVLESWMTDADKFEHPNGKDSFDRVNQLLMEMHMTFADHTFEQHANLIRSLPSEMKSFWVSRNHWNLHKVVEDMTPVYEIGFLNTNPLRPETEENEES